MSAPHLRLRVRDDLTSRKRRVEVLDVDDNVLGDLAGSVMEMRWVATANDQPACVSIDFACERTAIDSIEVAGYNAPRRPND